jgi:hypothetical protein
MLLVVAAFSSKFLTAPPTSMGLMMPLKREALFQFASQVIMTSFHNCCAQKEGSCLGLSMA